MLWYNRSQPAVPPLRLGGLAPGDGSEPLPGAFVLLEYISLSLHASIAPPHESSKFRNRHVTPSVYGQQKSQTAHVWLWSTTLIKSKSRVSLATFPALSLVMLGYSHELLSSQGLNLG